LVCIVILIFSLLNFIELLHLLVNSSFTNQAPIGKGMIAGLICSGDV